MSDMQSLLAEMQNRFSATAADGVDKVFQYDIDDHGSWQIEIQNGACNITEGTGADADVTLSMDKDTFASVLSGETDGMQAFMTGSIQATGDIMLATRLSDIFPQTGA